jgi:hypothetical protein
MAFDLPGLAGTVSTIMFVIGALPMLHKAFSTKDMASYSLGNLLLMNVGNAIYAIYVFSLPPGPIWALHGFWLVATALMLGWYLRFEWYPKTMGETPTAPTGPTSLPAAA